MRELLGLKEAFAGRPELSPRSSKLKWERRGGTRFRYNKREREREREIMRRTVVYGRTMTSIIHSPVSFSAGILRELSVPGQSPGIGPGIGPG